MAPPDVIHLLTGEYPPDPGGVSDYTAVLAEALCGAGCRVHVWAPPGASGGSGPVHVHRVPDRFGREMRRALRHGLSEDPGTVLLQYVPNALGARGANVAFCRWLAQLGGSRDVRVMFHEPYFYFGLHPGRNALALIQRYMARELLRGSRCSYISTEAWRAYLTPWAPRAASFTTLPIPATVPLEASPEAIAGWRRRLGGAEGGTLAGHFGTYGGHMAAELRRLVPALLTRHAGVRLVCIGRGSQRFVEGIGATRVIATGELSAAEVSAVLRACDLMIQPYPDGVTTRRTSVMAALGNGVPVLTTQGRLTEGAWAGAVALAPAGDAHAIGGAAAALLEDRQSRAALAAAGQRHYDAHFAVGRTVERLLDVGLPSSA